MADEETPAPQPARGVIIVPPPEDIERIKLLLYGLIERNVPRPYEKLEIGDIQKLVHFMAGQDFMADHLFAQVRSHAETIPGWNRGRINAELSAAGIKANARNLKAEHDEENRKARRAERASSRENTRRALVPPGEVRGMTDDAMIESDSIRLKIIGHLSKRVRARIWYDDFYKAIMTDWSGTLSMDRLDPRPLDDDVIDNIVTWLHTIDATFLGGVTDKSLLSPISYFAKLDRRNEPREWLEGLKWDEKPRLKDLMPKAYQTPDDEYHQAVGRCWIVSMVARILDPGCKVDTMPVFQGGEGIFKSQSLEIIGGKYYSTSASDIHTKDFKQELWSKVLIEVPELHSLMGSAVSIEKTKAVLSTRVDVFRAPYDRLAREHKRSAVLVGTTNTQQWNVDPTGGRRFWPIKVDGRIDLDWLRQNMAQLWAEAVHYYLLWRTDKDERGMWWNVPLTEQEEMLVGTRAVPVFANRIQEWMDVRSEEVFRGVPGTVPAVAANRYGGGINDVAWGTLVTTDRVAEQGLGLHPEMWSRNGNIHKIAEALRYLGWRDHRAKVSGSKVPVRFWVSGGTDRLQITRAPVPGESAAPEDPFDNGGNPFG